MHIQVKGKQIDIGSALSTHVETELTLAVEKYFDRTVDAVVTFTPEAHMIRCDSKVHLPTGLTVQSTGAGRDAYTAFDQGAERIEKQLRRYKRRLRDHHRDRAAPVDIEPAQSYVLQGAAEGSDEAEPDTLDPVIIAETSQDLQQLSVGEAVMQMELADQHFLLFRHEKSGAVNLVFRREDGHIGWIDPAPMRAGV